MKSECFDPTEVAELQALVARELYENRWGMAQVSGMLRNAVYATGAWNGMRPAGEQGLRPWEELDDTQKMAARHFELFNEWEAALEAFARAETTEEAARLLAEQPTALALASTRKLMSRIGGNIIKDTEFDLMPVDREDRRRVEEGFSDLDAMADRVNAYLFAHPQLKQELDMIAFEEGAASKYQEPPSPQHTQRIARKCNTRVDAASPADGSEVSGRGI